MNQDKNVFQATIESVSDYVEANVQYAKLSIAQGGSKAVSGVILGVAVLLLSLFFITFVSVAAALAFGVLLGGLVYGFLVVAGIYFLMMVLIVALRKSLILNPVVKVFAKMLFEDEKDYKQPNK